MNQVYGYIILLPIIALLVALLIQGGQLTFFHNGSELGGGEGIDLVEGDGISITAVSNEDKATYTVSTSPVIDFYDNSVFAVERNALDLKPDGDNPGVVVGLTDVLHAGAAEHVATYTLGLDYGVVQSNLDAALDVTVRDTVDNIVKDFDDVAVLNIRQRDHISLEGVAAAIPNSSAKELTVTIGESRGLGTGSPTAIWSDTSVTATSARLWLDTQDLISDISSHRYLRVLGDGHYVDVPLQAVLGVDEGAAGTSIAAGEYVVALTHVDIAAVLTNSYGVYPVYLGMDSDSLLIAFPIAFSSADPQVVVQGID